MPIGCGGQPTHTRSLCGVARWRLPPDGLPCWTSVDAQHGRPGTQYGAPSKINGNPADCQRWGDGI